MSEKKVACLIKAIIAAVVSLSMFIAAPALAVVGGVPISTADARFDAVGLVLTDQPWAPCGGWVSGTCTLINSNVVVLAKHSVEDGLRRLPAPGARTHKIRFRRGADGSANNQYGLWYEVDCAGGYQEIYVHQFIANPWPGVDMVLGILESAPIGIVPMPIAPSHNVASGQTVLLAGWGFDGACVGQGQAWTLRADWGVVPPLRFNAWCCFDYNNGTFLPDTECIIIPPGVDWVVGNLHDSGAPLLTPDPSDPSRLRLFAIVTTMTSAQKLSAWNEAGGQPQLAPLGDATHCIADFNRNGTVGIEDLLEFAQSYVLGHASADIDRNQQTGPHDLFVFLQHYAGGC